MASYPGTIFSQSNPSGTTLVSDLDHALQHSNLNGEVTAIETTVGTTGGTNVLKNFVAGDLGARINASNVPQQPFSAGTYSGQQINSGTVSGGVIGTTTIQGGTVANASLGTPTILGGTILGSGTTVPISVGVNLAPTVGTLADSSVGTIFANAQAAQVFEITLGTNATNRTLGTPQNPTNGQIINYRIKQNAAAVGTILFATVFRFSSDIGTPTLGTASTWTYIGWRYNSTDVKWDFQCQSTNLI